MWLLALTCFFIPKPQTSGSEPPRELRTIQQVYALGTEEAAGGYPVKLRGVVTLSDGGRRTFYIQDSTLGLVVRGTSEMPISEYYVDPDQLVEVKGVTVAGRLHPFIRSHSVRIIGDGKKLVPLQLTPKTLLGDDAENCLIRISGWVFKIARVGNGLGVKMLVGPGLVLDITVLDADSPEASALHGALVDATGVLSFRFDASGRKTEPRLTVSNLSGLKRGKVLPLTHLDEIGKVSAKAPSQEPVRAQGTVVDHNLGEHLVLRDSSGSLRIPFRDLTYYTPGTLVEVFAVTLQNRPELVLTNLFLRRVSVAAQDREPAVVEATPAAANTNLPLITQLAEIRKLTPLEASRGFPVKASAVVTYWQPATYMHFVQDETSGIYVDLSRIDPKPQFAPGQQLTIEGYTAPGGFAPIVVAHSIVQVGEGALPTPATPTFQKLMTGRYDSQYVSLRGTVRNQWLDGNPGALALAVPGGVVKINVNDTRKAAPKSFVDDAIEVRGVCSTASDDRRHLQRVELQVYSWDDVQVREEGAPDPFSLPVSTVADLFQFQAEAKELHRTRIMGAVSLRMADGSFYLQDSSGGILAQPATAVEGLAAGSTVDVVGFLSKVDRAPVLQDAKLLLLNQNGTRQPSEIKTDAPLDATLHGTLIKTQGKVLGYFARAGEELLTVEAGQWVTDVVLERTGEAAVLGNVPVGALVQLTGVYLARMEDDGQARSFHIQLRSPADVKVLSAPSWWNLRRTAWALGGCALVLLLALGWVGMLRKQVAVQTGRLQDEIDQRKGTEDKLRAEIAQRKQVQAEVEKTHAQLLIASRQAGMAEIATNVLHNVGNVLNSVNVSTSVIADRLRQSKISNIMRVAQMLPREPQALQKFILEDPKGQRLPAYLSSLAEHLTTENASMREELDSLAKNVEHIKEIVAVQQNYAKVMGVIEKVNPVELVEDALRMNQESLARHNIHVVRDYAPDLPVTTLDKHKAMQILVNLITNAKNACMDAGVPDKQLTLRVAHNSGSLTIAVIDNGLGILQEHMSIIFSHGFTSRKEGHGFGLHSGALAAKEMGGSLRASSEGPGKGATFTLELPVEYKTGTQRTAIANPPSNSVVANASPSLVVADTPFGK